MAQTKSYNPKTAAIKDIYKVHDAGHDRWFIPSIAPEAPMAKQLAQCQLLSPHGEGRDENPTDPLVITKAGVVNGSLMMGGTVKGHQAEVKDGKKPYVTTVQPQWSANQTTWTDRGSPLTPDSKGDVTWVNNQNDGGRYWRIVTVITDADNTTLSDTSPSYGPVQVVNPSIFGPDPSTISVGAGQLVREKWNGSGAYTVSFGMEIGAPGTGTATLTSNVNHASSINGMYPDAQLETLMWENISTGWWQLTIQRLVTASGTQTFEFTGTVTDTYQSTSADISAALTVNLTSASAVTVDGGITGNKKIGDQLVGTASTFSDAGTVTAKWMRSTSADGTYEDVTSYEAPVDGKVYYTQTTADAGYHWKLRTRIITEDGQIASDSASHGPTLAANANISEYSVSPISVPVGQTTSKDFPGTYNYNATWSMTYTDDSGWQTQPWMQMTNIAEEYNAMFGTAFTMMQWQANNGIMNVNLATGPGQAAGWTVQTQMKLTDSITDSAGTDSDSDIVPQNYETT